MEIRCTKPGHAPGCRFCPACRRSLEALKAQTETASQLQTTRLQVETLQTRLGVLQQQAAATLNQTRSEVARLRGELARQPRKALHALPTEAGAILCSPRAQPIPCASLSAETAQRLPRTAPATPARLAAPDAPSMPALTAMAAVPAVQVEGPQVLCVGGIQHAVARYRARIEQRGGRFEHHDGGIEDSAHALEARLNRADVVICQAACINHEAYHRVKRHCERTGTPCIYLDRPSLSRFDRALAPPTDAVQRNAAHFRA